MVKKLLCLFICAISVTFLSAQELPLLNTKELTKSNTELTFDKLVKNYENYFATKDIDAKGSGYKPFKRWEYHWSHYLQSDGTIAPASALWKAWEEKQKMTATKSAGDWSDKGPFDQSSKSGQGRINTILVDPNTATTIYAGAPAGGLWKSTDDGVNWTPLTDDLPQIGVSGIAIHPSNSNIIYISTGDDDASDSYSVGVLKSIDGGATWNTTGLINATSTSSNEIFIDPTDATKVWVATDAGLYQSTNAGDTWTRKIPGHIRDFKLKPGDSQTIYAVTSNTFFVSTNEGATFSSTSTGIPSASLLGRLRVEVTPAAPDNVYLLAAEPGSESWGFEGIFKSTDSGASFTKTIETTDIFGSTQAWYDLAFAISNTNANFMFVGVLDVWKSIDGGDNVSRINNWQVVNSRFTHADIHFMRYFDGVLYVGSDGGVFRSTDNGNSFDDLTKDLSISQFYKVSVSKQNSAKMAGGLQDNGGFSLSNNLWHNYHGGDGMDAASDPNDENTFYGFTQFGGALTKTTDGGLTSIGVAGAPVTGNWVTPLVINKASEVYAGYNQLYKLDGNIWRAISSHNFGNLEAVEIDPSNNNNIFVSRGSNLYLSTDRGVTFTTRTRFQTGITGVNISSIEVHNANSNIVWLTTTGNSNLAGPSSGHTGGGVYKSTDGGLTFTDIGTGLPNESKFVVRHHPFTTNNAIYVGTALGVYHLNDDISSWEVFSTNLPNVAVPDIEINPYDNTITAATYGRSVWQSPIPAITLPAIEADLLKTSPSSTIVGCGGTITPSVTVINNGTAALNSFTVNYNIDSGANQSFNWTGTIAPSATLKIDLPAIAAPSDGDHTISAEIDLTNDSNTFNNSNSSTFTINQNEAGVGQVTYTFGDPNPGTSENASEWTVSDDNLWEIGTPTTTDLNGVVSSGYVTNPSGNHPDQTTSLLTSPCYNLSNLEDPVLKFKMAFDLEPNWDIIYMEYSTDQGLNWQILGTANDPNWYNSDRTNASSGPSNDCQNCPGAQWTGLDATLKEYSYDLSALNSESSIIFRFKFVSDFSVNEEGVVVDDFIIDATKILSVNDFEEGEFLIFPNPSNDIFNISRNNTIGENMTLKVYDLMGKLIRERTNITEASYELSMNGVSKGIYFLHLNIDNRRLVKKLILK